MVIGYRHQVEEIRHILFGVLLSECHESCLYAEREDVMGKGEEHSLKGKNM